MTIAELFKAHIHELWMLSLQGDERATKSLVCIVLAAGLPTDGGGPGEPIEWPENVIPFRKAA